MWRKLQVDKAGIRLDLTLLSGQSFRWKETAPGEWTNVLSGFVWTLKQIENDIFYRVFKSRSLKKLKKERVLEEIQPSPISKTDDESQFYDTILRDYFQLHVDVEPLFEQWRASDPHFAEVSEKFRGVRLLRQNPVETLFSFICSSNNSIPRISGMVEKLCQEYGKKLGEMNGLAYYSFPDIDDLNGPLVEQHLRDMGFGYRAKFISQSANYILQHHDGNWLENLRSVSYEEAHTGKTTVKLTYFCLYLFQAYRDVWQARKSKEDLAGLGNQRKSSPLPTSLQTLLGLLPHVLLNTNI